MHKRHRTDHSLPVSSNERKETEFAARTRRETKKRKFSARNCRRRLLYHGFLVLIALSILNGGIPRLIFYLQVTRHQDNLHPVVPELHGPLPQNVSVVLMNYGRPKTLQKLLPTLTSYPYIDNILICHAHPATKFDYIHQKVQNVDAVESNRRYGLALRFNYCTSDLIWNNWVIHMDDDQYVSHRSLDQLLAAFAHNPHRIVGRHGRGYSFGSNPDNHGYRTTNVMGDVEVVLTKLLVVERGVCRAFVEKAPLVEDLVATATPKWNGEDIFLSLVANHYYRERYGSTNATEFPNLALPLVDVREAPILDDASDISGTMNRHSLHDEGLLGYFRHWWKGKRHLYYRGRLWAEAKARLALSTTISTV